MAKLKSTEAVTKIVDVLTPFESPERQKIVHAVLTLLGESTLPAKNPDAGADLSDSAGGDDTGIASLPPKAKSWAKQNKLAIEEIEQVFHIENGEASVIAAAMPGKNNREKTINAYVLRGVAALLSKGEVTFDDKSARAICIAQGCYDSPNHAVTMKAVGNKITGAKDKGWTITSPGLTYGASLIKELTKKSE